MTGVPCCGEMRPQLLGEILTEQRVRVDGRGSGVRCIDQKKNLEAAKDSAPIGRGHIPKWRGEVVELGFCRLAQHSNQLFLCRAIKEAQQPQHGDFRAGFAEMLYVGPEEMLRVVAMFGVLGEQWNLSTS